MVRVSSATFWPVSGMVVPARTASPLRAPTDPRSSSDWRCSRSTLRCVKVSCENQSAHAVLVALHDDVDAARALQKVA